jgi:hypothetical protein
VVEVKDFWSISLIHSGAKLMAKVLSSCLAPLVVEIVGPWRVSSSMDAIFMTTSNWCICTTRKLHVVKRDVILLKFDITKAFDTVGWDFLLEVLAKIGFRQGGSP